jgi:glycosyltransferase involved in cell wall biosynthesis
MTPLLYSLHSGNLYGTERMALATAIGLRDQFDITFVAPAGPVHQEAARLGFETLVFKTPTQYLVNLRPYFAKHKQVAAIGTRVLHTIVCDVWARLYGRYCANIQVVHGGADEKLSYGRKRWLNCLGAKQVAVSNYVKQRMAAHGSGEDRITVIENFLSPDRAEGPVQRAPFNDRGLRRVAIISRLDPIKRIDLLLDALDLDPSLRSIEFDVFGSGSDEAVLRERALRSYLNVHFHGFCSDVAERVTKADLLLHLCPEEPFGLAILEAMAARLVVLVPNAGGAGAIVEENVNGFHFTANDASALAAKLHFISQAPAEQLREVVAGGLRSLEGRFSAARGVAQYRKLIEECFQ